jgi:hypothetical protein
MAGLRPIPQRLQGAGTWIGSSHSMISEQALHAHRRDFMRSALLTISSGSPSILTTSALPRTRICTNTNEHVQTAKLGCEVSAKGSKHHPRRRPSAPLRQAEVDLQDRQIRSPAHALSKRALQIKHERVLTWVSCSTSGISCACFMFRRQSRDVYRRVTGAPWAGLPVAVRAAPSALMR